MSVRNLKQEKIDYILRTYVKTSAKEYPITQQKLEKMSVSKLNKVYRIIRQKAQTEIYDRDRIAREAKKEVDDIVNLKQIPPPLEPISKRQSSYEITDQEAYQARRDAISFIINNSKVTRDQLENKTDRQVSKVYNRLLKKLNDKMEDRGQPKMRTPSQIDLQKQIEIQDKTEQAALLRARERFMMNPSLRRQQKLIGGETMRVTRLPLVLSRLIGEYASEPDIRLQTVPTGKKRRQRLSVAFQKIIREQGGDFTDVLSGDYKTKDGRPVTKVSQISDYVLKQIYDDFSDEELKLFIDPTLPDDHLSMIELRAIRKELTGKKTVKQAEQVVKDREEAEKKRIEDKEREIRDTKEAVRISQKPVSQMSEDYVFEDEEEEKEPLKAEDLFKPFGYPMNPEIKTFWVEKEDKQMEIIPEENQQYDYALLNKAIYNPDPESVLNRSQRGRKFTILEEEINYMVVRNTLNGQTTLVLKGTDIKDLKGQRTADLVQDVGILLNNEDMVTRTKEMDAIAKRLKEEYGDIDVTGHSLSGYMANKISRDNDIDAIVFNMGSSPFKKSSREDNPNLVHYTTNVGSSIDPISVTAARLDKFETIQVQPDQDIGSGIIKYHTIDHFLEKEKKENVGINKMESLESILSKADIEPEREQRDPLADSVVRRVNHNFSFMENPLVPNRNESAVRGIIRDNDEMRNDPNPNIEPNQPILVQDEILEGDEDRMPEAEAENEIGRIANRNIAGTNMSSMEQNYFFREQNDIRRRQMRMLGQPEGEEYDFEEKDELEEKDEGIDNGDDLPFVGGSSNRELVEAQMKRMSNQRRGKWSGVDRGNSEDWRRIMSAKAKADDLITSKAVNYLRDKQIPWKAPSRTYANSYVGLIRNSNMAMTNAIGELLP